MMITVLDKGNGTVKVVMYGRVVIMDKVDYDKWSKRMGGKKYATV